MTPHKDSCLDPQPPAPTPLLPASSVRADALQVCHPPAAGIDIGAAEPWVAVPPGCDPQPVRRFGPCTADLDGLANWLLDGGVTPVAMASTGVSWMPVCALLEARGVQGRLSDPRHAKRAPGRPQTARLDGQWRPRRHADGLRAGAVRPEEQVGGRRRSLRHRPRLLTAAAPPIPPRQQAVQQMHRTRTQVVSDRTGGTGRAIRTAIVAGAPNPPRLAQRRTPHCHHEEDDIAKALQGPWRAAHLLA